MQGSARALLLSSVKVLSSPAFLSRHLLGPYIIGHLKPSDSQPCGGTPKPLAINDFCRAMSQLPSVSPVTSVGDHHFAYAEAAPAYSCAHLHPWGPLSWLEGARAHKDLV